MKIEWTTIESGKNKTHSKINKILENKSKISVFFSENKKHLFWAWISTMAMAFVVTAWQMSWTEFSADLMYPSLTQEIADNNWEEWNIQKVPANFTMIFVKKDRKWMIDLLHSSLKYNKDELEKLNKE